MIARVDGTEFGLEETLLDRHRDDSKLSDFQGSREELVMLTASTYMDELRRRGGLRNLLSGKDFCTYVLKGAPSDLFRARGKAITLHGVEKPPATEVDLIIRITSRHKNGTPRRVDLIDFQAWMNRCESEEQSAA